MSDLNGSYDIIANTPMGNQKMTITVKVDGDAFSGTSSGSMGTSDIAGTVAGNKLLWKQGITLPMPMSITCEATVANGEIGGKVDTGGFGSFPIKGQKVS